MPRRALHLLVISLTALLLSGLAAALACASVPAMRSTIHRSAGAFGARVVGQEVDEEEEEREEGEEGEGGGGRPSSPTGSQPAEGNPVAKVVRCVVPKLAGKTLTPAKRALSKAHCKLGNVSKRRARGKVGVVISQKPKAGTRLKSGSRVSVVLRRH